MISKRAIAIQPSITFTIDNKARQMRQAGIDVCSFGIGQPDFPTPDNVKEAGIKAIQSDKSTYTSAIGIVELREAVVEKFKRENNQSYAVENIAVGSGGKGILYHLFLALLDPGDEVIIPKPYWVSYPEQIALAGGILTLLRSILTICVPR
jgi:aspartate aminotransferase